VAQASRLCPRELQAFKMKKSINEFDEIELKIKEILEGVLKADADAGGLGAAEWTKNIKLQLCKLGQEKGFKISASGFEGAETGEWLFDLIWAYGEGEPWFFVEMPLVLECEWSPYDEDIWWDFEKLLVARTKYRIFIFNKRTDDKIYDLLQQFKEAILKFRNTQKGDRYFFAGYSFEGPKIIYSLVVV
jgi:hypothetical protein